MTSARKADHRPSAQTFLTQLQRLYGDRSVRRDPFGRRKALASEIAQVLACSVGNPELFAEEWNGHEHPVD
jgi:hypothetical protein